MGNGILRALVCTVPVPCGLASLWLPCQGDKGSWGQHCPITGGPGCYPRLQLGSLGPGRSGSKFTEQATHTAHQGCWTVPRASTALALGPDSEDSTIWLPLGVERRKGSEPGEEKARLPPPGCWELSLGSGGPGGLALSPAGLRKKRVSNQRKERWLIVPCPGRSGSPSPLPGTSSLFSFSLPQMCSQDWI